MSDALPAPQDLLQHAAFVRRLAHSLLSDPNAAEDVAQETWQAALEHPPLRDNARGWLARVLRNLVRRRHRAETRRAERERAAARDEALPPAEASHERTELLQRVVDAVRALEEPYRATILLRYYDDLAPDAIAMREGVPVATVHSRLKRGLARLRERLERAERDWRPTLGLIAGESPCLPPHAGEAALSSATEWKVALTFLAAAALWVLWPRARASEPPPASLATLAAPDSNRSTAPSAEPAPSDPARSSRIAREIDAAPAPVPEPATVATLEVRVVEGAARRPLEEFAVELFGSAQRLPGGGIAYEGGYFGCRAEHALVRTEIAVPDPAGKTLTVALTKPELGDLWTRLGFGDAARPEQEVHLTAGATASIVFALPERGVVGGIVVDELGTPIPDALVFFGEETRARGDEPFRPLRLERIHDGARTAADGWFELTGDGARLTAAHAEFSAATVDVPRASRIVLGARGALRGRVSDASGKPSMGLGLRLDHRSEGSATTTDELGRFAFERVEAGAHALWAGERSLLAGVRLAAGEELELELTNAPPSPVTLELRSAAPLELAGTRGVVIGLAQVFDLREVGASAEPGALRVDGGLRPGRYWLATRQGLAAPFTLAPGEERAAVALGAAELVVRATRHTSVQVVPAGADAFLRLAAARVRVSIEADGEARFALAPGAYALVGEAGVVLRTLELPAAGLALSLD